jgi:hypothetical protein
LIPIAALAHGQANRPVSPRYLALDFGRLDQQAISLRPIARFDKPGSRTRLAIYEVTRR